jgi:hypothetical protein
MRGNADKQRLAQVAFLYSHSALQRMATILLFPALAHLFLPKIIGRLTRGSLKFF